MSTNTTSNRLTALAFCLLALGVALGAFGAHGLKSLVSAELLANWQTAVFYHLIHAVALAIVSQHFPVRNSFKWAARLYLLGICVFSGGLYLYVLSQLKFFALIVPLGGLSFIAGHLWAARQFLGNSLLQK